MPKLLKTFFFIIKKKEERKKGEKRRRGGGGEGKVKKDGKKMGGCVNGTALSCQLWSSSLGARADLTQKSRYSAATDI